jgi:hypothetical protein
MIMHDDDESHRQKNAYEPAASPTPAFLCHCGAKCGPQSAAIEPNVPLSGHLNASPWIPPFCPIWLPYGECSSCMVTHGSQVGHYGSHIALDLHTARHGSQLNHMAPIWCNWLPYNAVHLLYNNTQLLYGAHILHLTPRTSYMVHKVYRVFILPPFGFHMMQREPHAPLGCHVHYMGAMCIL